MGMGRGGVRGGWKGSKGNETKRNIVLGKLFSTKRNNAHNTGVTHTHALQPYSTQPITLTAEGRRVSPSQLSHTHSLLFQYFCLS